MPRISFKPSTKFISLYMALFLTAGFVLCFRAEIQRIQRFAASANPKVTVWAWQRDEDLSYINPNRVSVAYFAGNIYVRGSLVSLRPRTEKLKLPPGAETIPVFRIETVREDAIARENPGSTAAKFVAKTIADRLEELRGGSKMVQIDFDALEDERPFYKALLKHLRVELPAGTRISITSLASWLMADRWLETGSADEVVAMLFSIGAGKRDVLSRLAKEGLDSGARIPIAIGISASERNTNKSLFAANLQRTTASLYIFNSRPWTESRLQAITSEALAER